MRKILLPLIALLPLFSIAGGFQVNLQGNQQTGMGHLGTGFYLGASSAYFNPAMMGLGEGENKIRIEAGASFIFSNVAYQSQLTGTTERTDNPTGTPFYLYGTYDVNEKVSVGLAIYTPFGSSVDWGDDWTGKNLIQDISLRAIFVQPTVSYKITDDLRIGAGFSYVDGAVEINRALPAPIGNNNTVNLEGSTNAFGFNTGLYYQASEKLSIGFTYKSQVDVELEGGDVDFSVDPILASGFPDTEFDATLPLPAMTSIGIGYQHSEKLLLSVELNMVAWSAYESLDFDFKDNTSSLDDSKNPRNYEDAIIVRVGGQYTLNENVKLRAGAYYDQSPIQDEYFNPETPNTDNIGLTLGFSYEVGDSFGIDASFLSIIGLERESEYKPAGFGGKYKASSAIPGIGLHYNF